MKNITLSVEDGIYHSARVAAAERKTSVSAIVRNTLAELAGKETRLADAKAAGAEKRQRLKLVKLLEQSEIDLTERPTREASYAHRRFH